MAEVRHHDRKRRRAPDKYITLTTRIKQSIYSLGILLPLSMAAYIQDVIMCFGDSITQGAWEDGGFGKRLSRRLRMSHHSCYL